MENPCKRITDAIDKTLMAIADGSLDREMTKLEMKELVDNYRNDYDTLPPKCQELYNICDRFVAALSSEPVRIYGEF